MTPATLRHAGECLHGEHWQNPLSRQLNINQRTMRRWAVDGAPDFVAAQLLTLLAQRRVKIDRVYRRLSKISVDALPPPE